MDLLCADILEKLLTLCQLGNNIGIIDTVSDVSRVVFMQTINRGSQRRNEIIKACRELYEKMNFKDISIKEISLYTSFSRPSIYNYFATKESIFLEIFKEEYVIWCDSMEKILSEFSELTIENFSEKIAFSLDSRPVLLKLLSMNIYDLEENCTLDDLISFKKEYKRALNLMQKLLNTYFPLMTQHNVDNFIYIFFPFMFGLYPYASATKKQKEAMTIAGINYPSLGVYDFVYQTILTLLNSNLNNK